MSEKNPDKNRMDSNRNVRKKTSGESSKRAESERTVRKSEPFKYHGDTNNKNQTGNVDIPQKKFERKNKVYDSLYGKEQNENDYENPEQPKSLGESVKDFAKDGKDIADAVSQKNTLAETNKLKKDILGINPFDVKSIKKGVDDSVNQGIKMGLDKAGYGLGTVLEKINKRIPLLKKTKDGRIDYTQKMPLIKLLLWAIALAIFVGVWLLFMVILLAVILGASYFALDDKESSSSPKSATTSKEASTSNSKSIGGLATPKELEGVVLMPVVDFLTSGFGGRTINGRYEFHYGYDMQANKGNAYNRVYANIEGTIVSTKLDMNLVGEAKGNYVAVYNEKYKIIVSNQHLRSFNSHPKLKENMKIGNKVKIDTLIGFQGNTGASGLPDHLHVDTYINITPEIADGFNPYKYYNNTKHSVDPASLITCNGKERIPSKVSGYPSVTGTCKAYAMKMRKLTESEIKSND